MATIATTAAKHWHLRLEQKLLQITSADLYWINVTYKFQNQFTLCMSKLPCLIILLYYHFLGASFT